MKLLNRIIYQANMERIAINLLRAQHYAITDKGTSDIYFEKARDIARKTIPIAKKLGKSLDYLLFSQRV